MENLLPQNVGSIINYLQLCSEAAQWGTPSCIDHNQLQTMASETVDPWMLQLIIEYKLVCPRKLELDSSPPSCCSIVVVHCALCITTHKKIWSFAVVPLCVAIIQCVAVIQFTVIFVSLFYIYIYN